MRGGGRRIARGKGFPKGPGWPAGGWLGAAAAAAAAWWLGPRAVRAMVDRAADAMVRRLLLEPYPQNLWELVAGFGHNPLQPTLENALRAYKGRAIQRPIGTHRRFRDFSGLMFQPVQLVRRPLNPDEPVDTRVTIGPRAERPTPLDIPVLLGAMAYGVALSERVAVAVARASALAGTACNTGNGPLLPQVRQEARTVVLQYTGSPWTARPEWLRQGDLIEVRVGRGAWAGMGNFILPGQIPPAAARRMGIDPNDTTMVPSGPPEADTPEGLRRLLQDLRELTRGAPVGVKLAASHYLEQELDALLEAGADFVSLDGAQAGTHGSPPILQDDFGLPTLHATVRARNHLDRRGASGQVTLLVGGGLLTPGDCLKCLALGADAVYMTSAALFAVAHHQVTHALPWEPPTQVVWAVGSAADSFDVKQGAERLANFLKAFADEMAIGARALGKRALRDVDRSDLVALDPETAAITGVPLAWKAHPDAAPSPRPDAAVRAAVAGRAP